MKCRISQAHEKIFRAVEGAVYNTACGHPKWKLTSEMARSIAKRATGTLTANWPDVLAAHAKPSDPANDPTLGGHWPPRRHGRHNGGRKKRVRRPTTMHPHFRSLWKKLGIMAGKAKREGKTEREEALVEVLRLISK